jgi:AcrR family transcriptional regulator
MRIVKSAEERKNEILDVAAALFAEKGYDNASTNDIIEKIGIARGTLYHHFGSKEEILDALVDRMTREGVKRAGTIVRDKNCPILDRLTGILGSLSVESGAGEEIMEQMHKPQNALLHQKMQERLIKGIVPLITQLITEGNISGISIQSILRKLPR